jgi:hypothetical protein
MSMWMGILTLELLCIAVWKRTLQDLSRMRVVLYVLALVVATKWTLSSQPVPSSVFGWHLASKHMQQVDVVCAWCGTSPFMEITSVHAPMVVFLWAYVMGLMAVCLRLYQEDGKDDTYSAYVTHLLDYVLQSGPFVAYLLVTWIPTFIVAMDAYNDGKALFIHAQARYVLTLVASCMYPFRGMGLVLLAVGMIYYCICEQDGTWNGQVAKLNKHEQERHYEQWMAKQTYADAPVS